MKKISIISIILLLGLNQLFAVTDTNNVSGVERYAIYIGANYGGRSRERLLYAGSDAISFKNAMSEIGGVTESNSRMLFDPTKDDVDRALQQITETILNSSSTSKRSEFIFYYSGHSDENSLLLGDSKYDYSKLKAAITEVPSDIHVVILDSCYSGNFIRTKGGQKRKPFLIDDSSVVTGHAYLSSSSDDESSQESDEIESSFFTNAMITGLRGAADTSGDNKVTLNELYSYAFNDTLSKTEASKAGPQHPNFNITLVGSGDLVLSDISEGESMLSLSKEAKGRFIIRDSNDKLISEINKIAGQPIFMALPAGQYSAVIIDDYSTRQGYFILDKDQVYVLDQNNLSTIKRKTNRLRGDEKEKPAAIENDEDEEFMDEDFDFDNENDEILSKDELFIDDKDKPVEETDWNLFDFETDNFEVFNLAFVPGLSFVNNDSNAFFFSIGILGSKVNELHGIQCSTFMNISTGNVIGAQVSSLANISRSDFKGVQLAGLFNINDDIFGGQAAGLFNISNTSYGPQIAGLFNISKSVHAVQLAGLFNISNIVDGSQVAPIFNIAKEIDGVQASALFNVTDYINGVQISAFMNIAKKVNGLQIALFNYAEDVNGIVIGLFNYVQKGVHDICLTWDTNDTIDLYYKGGTPLFFTTLGFQAPRDSIFEEDERDLAAVCFGVGTKFLFPKSSLDLEYTTKMIGFSDNNPDYAEANRKLDNMNIDDRVASLFVPSFKVTWNALESKYAAIMLGFDFDIHIYDFNDVAFDVMNHNLELDLDDFAICPSFKFGIRAAW